MAKRKSTRPKKLRLVDNSPIGLTESQRKELRDLYRPSGMQSLPAIDSDIEATRRIALERLLYLYIECLCHDAALEDLRKSGTRKGGALTTRRKVVENIGRIAGVALSPSDIIKRLSSIAPLPAFAADAIRRDFLRVTV